MGFAGLLWNENQNMTPQTDLPTYPRLEEWVLELAGDPYQPPEQQVRYLSGKVYGHPKCEDGRSVRTSVVIETNGRLVTTQSGTVYQLGRVDASYRAWAEANFPGNWNDDHPIRVANPLA